MPEGKNGKKNGKKKKMHKKYKFMENICWNEVPCNPALRNPLKLVGLHTLRKCLNILMLCCISDMDWNCTAEKFQRIKAKK